MSKKKLLRKPVWLAEHELEWLLALLQVEGDPLHLRKPFTDTLNCVKEDKLRLAEIASRPATDNFVLEPPPKDWGEKKKRCSKRELTRAELEELVRVLS